MPRIHGLLVLYRLFRLVCLPAHICLGWFDKPRIVCENMNSPWVG
jgi:hypothetical protein